MRKTILLFIFIGIITNVYGQFADRQVSFPQISSPNVASFNKFIDHPISLYNGTPDISIPIYTIKDGAIELPIGLRYNTSGIKVMEEASWVGLGWNLNVGGIISQNIPGYCDEEDTEYNKFLNTPVFNPFFTTEPICGYYLLPYNLPIHQKIGDIVTKKAWYSTHGLAKLEPDVFYFSYPGNSGKFIIDYRTNKVYLLSRQENIKIEFISNPKGFVITTTEGIKHIFTRMFDVIGDGIESVSYGLTSSLYPNSQSITYEYEVYTTKSYSKQENYITAYYDKSDLIQESNYGINGSYSGNMKVYEGKELVLKNIKTPNYEVNFITSSRLDSPKDTQGKKLSEIKISAKDKANFKETKQFIFNYDYFLANHANYYHWNIWVENKTESIDWAGKRLKLLNVYEAIGDQKKNQYNFFYQESPLLPRKDSYAVDYWGYSNGCSMNRYLIPDLEKLLFSSSYYDGVLEAYRRKTDTKGHTGDRSYNFNYCKTAILTGIKYPTGGYTEFEFEPNTFSKLGAKSAGVRPLPPGFGWTTSIIDEYNFTPTSQEFYNGVSATTNKEVKDQNSSLTNSICQFTIEEKANVELSVTLTCGNYTWRNLAPYSHNVYVKKINGTQKTIVHNTLINRNNLDAYSNTNTDYKAVSNLSLEPGVYELVADLANELGDLLSGDYYYRTTALSATISYPNPKSSYPKFSTGCGLRIKRINHYQNNGDTTPLMTTNYEYNDPQTNNSSGMLHDILNYVDVTRKLTLSRDVYPARNIYPNVVNIYSNSTASNPYGNSSGVGYTYVKEIRKGGNDVGYTISKFKNDAGYFRFREGGVRIDMPLNGKLEEQSVYNDKNIQSQSEKYNYITQTSNSYWGITFKDTYLDAGQEEAILGSHEWGMFYDSNINSRGGSRVLIYKTEIKSYDIMMTGKESLIDGITTKEDYTYNPQTLQLKDKKITTEPNNSVKYSYTYPNDYNCGVYAQMTTNNMLSSTVEEKIYRNDGYIGGTLTEYGYTKDNKIIIPQKRYFSEVISKMTNPVTFTCTSVNKSIYPSQNVIYQEYDTFGNPVYIIHNEVTNIVYLWGYQGQYLIAEIKNATYQEVKEALGNIAPESLSTATTPNMALINGLRTHAKTLKAHVSTFTYAPLVGMLTSTEPSGITTYYDYDSFGRLKETYIIEGGVKKIVQSYNYNYKNK